MLLNQTWIRIRSRAISPLVVGAPSIPSLLSVAQWHFLHYGRDVVCPSLSTGMQIVRGTMALPHGTVAFPPLFIRFKGRGNTMRTYTLLLRALDMDDRAEEAHQFWVKKVGAESDLHSVPWQVHRLMIVVYYRNNVPENLIKIFGGRRSKFFWQLRTSFVFLLFHLSSFALLELFKGLEAFGRKPPEQSIVQRVADAYEMLGLVEEK
ncbi:hypothetical protein GQ457_06G020160 [Hibiscus cannabinus]